MSPLCEVEKMIVMAMPLSVHQGKVRFVGFEAKHHGYYPTMVRGERLLPAHSLTDSDPNPWQLFLDSNLNPIKSWNESDGLGASTDWPWSTHRRFDFIRI